MRMKAFFLHCLAVRGSDRDNSSIDDRNTLSKRYTPVSASVASLTGVARIECHICSTPRPLKKVKLKTKCFLLTA